MQIDANKERISLGIKQLQGDAFADHTAANGKNAVVTGVVTDVTAKEAKVRLAQGVDAFLRSSEMSQDAVEDARHEIKTGDEITAKIINVDQRNRSIALSIKARMQQDEREAHEEYQRKQDAQTGPSQTVGDLVKTQLKDSDGEA